MKGVAIVPVKHLAATKSRLLPQLPEAEREAFALAMLQDVLDALLAAESIERVYVATPDHAVAALARAAGAEAIVRDDPGLNAAISGAAGAVALPADSALLVVLGDVAGAMPADVDALFDALPDAPRAAALAPSADGGTCALLLHPHDALAPCFGRDSAERHREAAHAGDVAFALVPLPSLAIDLDVPEDVERFLQTERGGAHTRACLAGFGWGAAS